MQSLECCLAAVLDARLSIIVRRYSLLGRQLSGPVFSAISLTFGRLRGGRRNSMILCQAERSHNYIVWSFETSHDKVLIVLGELGCQSNQIRTW